MTVGERIREKRIELGWSQQELAKKAGYSDKTAISKIEHAGNEITLKQVKRIADAMYIEPSELMGWTEEPINDSQGDREEALNEYAKLLFDHYQKASPEIQKAVDLLLKADKQS